MKCSSSSKQRDHKLNWPIICLSSRTSNHRSNSRKHSMPVLDATSEARAKERVAVAAARRNLEHISQPKVSLTFVNPSSGVGNRWQEECLVRVSAAESSSSEDICAG